MSGMAPGFARALLARNPWGADFQSRIAFLDMAGKQQSCTGDRSEFIGRKDMRIPQKGE